MNKKTIKLYDLNAYSTEFEAKVLSCTPDEKSGSGFIIELDKTLFFPEEGGQTPDKGFLTVDSEKDGNEVSYALSSENGIAVEDVQIVGGRIFHYTQTPIGEGVSVKGTIDWEHRFSNMQQHTGEHIFSGIVHESFGYENVGFHLSDTIVTMDYSGPLSSEELAQIERRVNRAIYENIEVIAEYPEAQKLSELNYRSKKELSGDIRIVTIPGYDVCACCAPHVRRTGEIGILKVISSQNYKGGTRVSILCGNRALTYLASEHDMLNELACRLSTSWDQIPAQFDKLKDENALLKRKLSEFGEMILSARIDSIPAELENVCIFADKESDPNVVRRSVNQMVKSRKGYCGIFWGDTADGYRFIIGCGPDRNSNDLLAEFKEKFQVRGGGAPAMVQGSITGATPDAIENIFRKQNSCKDE